MGPAAAVTAAAVTAAAAAAIDAAAVATGASVSNLWNNACSPF